MASGLLQKEKGYLYGKDALMQPLLDAYARTGKTPSPSDAARLGLLGYIAPVRSPYLDVDETSDDARLEGSAPEFLRDAYGAVMAPRDVATGKVSPEEGANRALNLIAVGGLMSPKPSGSFGIFGGRESKTAPIGDFMIAERMAERGIGRELIHRDTGIYLDPVDKKMKYEISDDKAELTDYVPKFAADAAGKPKGAARDYYSLSSIIKHPEFFRAYPELADVPTTVAIDKYNRGGSVGRTKDGGSVMSVTGQDYDDVRSILLHEMQHLVQRQEKGFGQGGNLDSAYNYAVDEIDKQLNRASSVEISKADDARKQLYVLQRAERILKNRDITPRPRLLFGQGDWYKYSDRISGLLGAMPKRSGPKQKEWLRKAGKIMADFQIEDVTYFPKHLVKEAVEGFEGKLPELKKAVRRAEYKANKLNTEDVIAARAAQNRKERFLEESRQADRDEMTGPFKYDLYNRLAGEVEARNVEKRRDLTPQERRDKSPTSTRDVLAEDTIMTTNPALGLLYQQNPYREDSFGRYQGGLL